jgi:hypothetical protein
LRAPGRGQERRQRVCDQWLHALGQGSRTATACLRSMAACSEPGSRMVAHSRALGWGHGRRAQGQQAVAAVFGVQRQRQMEVFRNFAKCWERKRGA